MVSHQFIDRTSYAGIVASAGARASQVARAGPLDARVPHLSRWRLRDVVAHLGGVHRWAAEILTTRSMSVGHRRGRDQGDALLDWFDEGLHRLVSVLAAVDLDERCPNFSPGSPSTTGFWARRQAHETTMHRWDIEAAAGPVTPIEPMFATDGIDELFDVFTRTRGGQVLPEPVAVTCTGTGASWTVFPVEKPGRVSFERTPTNGGRQPVATISGTAENLLLAFWHRRSPEVAELTFTGRTALARGFLAGPTSA